jgi:hypothetical protein
MAGVLYLLGAGFNVSVQDRTWSLFPPLANNFFELLLSARPLAAYRDAIHESVDIDRLFAEIERYWHLTVEDLAQTSFDIEECMSFLQSMAMDEPIGSDRRVELEEAESALRSLLLMYLSDMWQPIPPNPPAEAFGREVLSQHADVITFNYDNAPERAIEFASGSVPVSPRG